jgi:hypothetical protein
MKLCEVPLVCTKDPIIPNRELDNTPRFVVFCYKAFLPYLYNRTFLLWIRLNIPVLAYMVVVRYIRFNQATHKYN